MRFEVPFTGGYRFLVVGTAESLDKDGLQIGGRGQIGRDLSCGTSVTMRCNGRPCPDQPITFESQDEPTGTLLCGREVRH